MESVSVSCAFLSAKNETMPNERYCTNLKRLFYDMLINTSYIVGVLIGVGYIKNYVYSHQEMTILYIQYSSNSRYILHHHRKIHL